MLAVGVLSTEALAQEYVTPGPMGAALSKSEEEHLHFFLYDPGAVWQDGALYSNDPVGAVVMIWRLVLHKQVIDIPAGPKETWRRVVKPLGTTTHLSLPSSRVELKIDGQMLTDGAFSSYTNSFVTIDELRDTNKWRGITRLTMTSPAPGTTTFRFVRGTRPPGVYRICYFMDIKKHKGANPTWVKSDSSNPGHSITWIPSSQCGPLAIGLFRLEEIKRGEWKLPN